MLEECPIGVRSGGQAGVKKLPNIGGVPATGS